MLDFTFGGAFGVGRELSVRTLCSDSSLERGPIVSIGYLLTDCAQGMGLLMHQSKKPVSSSVSPKILLCAISPCPYPTGEEMF